MPSRPARRAGARPSVQLSPSSASNCRRASIQSELASPGIARRSRCSEIKYARMRIASSLTRDVSFFVAGVFCVAAFFRGALAFLAAGFAAFPFSAAPSDGAVSVSLAFAFFGMA
jgi:hypothetical protein